MLAEVLLALPREKVVGLELLGDVEYERVGRGGLLQEGCEERRGRLRGGCAGTGTTQPLPTGEVLGVNWWVTVRERQETRVRWVEVNESGEKLSHQQ